MISKIERFIVLFFILFSLSVVWCSCQCYNL